MEMHLIYKLYGNIYKFNGVQGRKIIILDILEGPTEVGHPGELKEV